MILDHSVYPDIHPPPKDLPSAEDKADYLHRICGAFDFGIFPEPADWEQFAGWKEIFDRFPLPDSPGYHAFRAWYRWEPVKPERRLGLPHWKTIDQRDGRHDPCEEMV